MSQMRLPLRVVFVLLPLLILASGCATPLTKPQALLGVGDKPSGQIHVIDLKETESTVGSYWQNYTIVIRPVIQGRGVTCKMVAAGSPSRNVGAYQLPQGNYRVGPRDMLFDINDYGIPSVLAESKKSNTVSRGEIDVQVRPGKIEVVCIRSSQSELFSTMVNLKYSFIGEITDPGTNLEEARQELLSWLGGGDTAQKFYATLMLAEVGDAAAGEELIKLGSKDRRFSPYTRAAVRSISRRIGQPIGEPVRARFPDELHVYAGEVNTNGTLPMVRLARPFRIYFVDDSPVDPNPAFTEHVVVLQPGKHQLIAGLWTRPSAGGGFAGAMAAAMSENKELDLDAKEGQVYEVNDSPMTFSMTIQGFQSSQQAIHMPSLGLVSNATRVATIRGGRRVVRQVELLPEVAKDRELVALQGVWQVAGGDLDGKLWNIDELRKKDAAFADMSLEVKGRRMEWKGQKIRGKSIITELDTSSTPNQLTSMSISDGSVMHGIFEVSSNTLRYCWGARAPKEFKSDMRVGTLHFMMQRKVPAVTNKPAAKASVPAKATAAKPAAAKVPAVQPAPVADTAVPVAPTPAVEPKVEPKVETSASAKPEPAAPVVESAAPVPVPVEVPEVGSESETAKPPEAVPEPEPTSSPVPDIMAPVGR